MTTPALTEAQVANIIKAVQYASKFDFNGLYAALKAKNTKEILEDGFVDAEIIASIVGIFCPPAAVVANDMSAVQAIYILIEALKTIDPPHNPIDIAEDKATSLFQSYVATPITNLYSKVFKR